MIKLHRKGTAFGAFGYFGASPIGRDKLMPSPNGFVGFVRLCTVRKMWYFYCTHPTRFLHMISPSFPHCIPISSWLCPHLSHYTRYIYIYRYTINSIIHTLGQELTQWRKASSWHKGCPLHSEEYFGTGMIMGWWPTYPSGIIPWDIYIYISLGWYWDDNTWDIMGIVIHITLW